MKILSRLWIIFTIALVFGCEFGEEENSDSESSLTEGEWTDGKISKDGLIKKYTFTVSEWTRYFIFMNNAWNGDDKKSAYTGIKISHSDGTTISSSYSNVTSCYTKPVTFLSTSSGTITITLACNSSSSGWSSNWEKGTGTYAVKYTSRQNCITLSKGEWKDDDIIAVGQTNKYSVTVTDKTRYFIWLNDVDAGSGITTKTANVGLKISHSDDTVICNNYNNASSLYSKPYTFTATSDGTITITAAAFYSGWEKGTGTYAIRYDSRPEYDTLSAGEWKDDSIIATRQINKYSIDVTQGKTYSIYLNDTDAGSGVTNKTANVGLKIFYDQNSYTDNPIICGSYDNASSLYSKPYKFTAASTGTITITAAAYGGDGWETGTGTYAIRYTVSD